MRSASNPLLRAPGRGSRGFTIVELLTVVAIAGIVLTLAVPSFAAIYNGNRLTSAANDVVGALQMARMEAVRANAPVTVCRSTNGTTCAAGTTWTGWIVWVDRDVDNALDAGELLQSGVIEAPLDVRASPAIVNSRVVFRPDGLARNTAAGRLLEAQFYLCIPSRNPEMNVRRVALRAGSSVSVSPATNAGACPVNPLVNPT